MSHMNIIQKDDKMIIELELYQDSYDAVDELIGKTNNLIGVIAGDQFSISQLIDLGYKGDQQEGSPIIMFDTREELEGVCKNFGLQIWEHPICAYCGGVIRGSFTFGDKGNMCYTCELSKKYEK